MTSDIYLEERIELLEVGKRLRTNEFTLLRPKRMLSSPFSKGKKTIQSQSKLNLYACDGRLRLIRILKFTPESENIQSQTVHEETRIYSCENLSEVLNAIVNVEKGNAEKLPSKFSDPAYARCYHKTIVTEDGNYRIVGFMELRCPGSFKEPDKKLIARIDETYKRDGIKLQACNLRSYDQQIGLNKGLLLIETALEISKKTTSFFWQEERTYMTEKHEKWNRSLLSSHYLSAQKRLEHLGIVIAHQKNLITAKSSDDSPPNSEHSPHRLSVKENDTKTAKGQTNSRSSPPTAVHRPSTTNTAVSPSDNLMHKHGIREDHFSSWKSGNIWRKHSNLATSQKQQDKKTKSVQTEVDELAKVPKNVSHVTDDVTQLDFSSEISSQVNITASEKISHDDNEVTVYFGGQEGLDVAISTDFSFKLKDESGTDVSCYQLKEISVDDHIVYKKD
ncbi:unnamed protein product [Thelazia callipaeda]|uniref:IRS-type PTB domain-containing protein n=1 Tax=Thelazia callipaeda TaxID=103827 RepID=A0A158RBZ7_THECL|nr:unnamed protein product [Thelazia callipaeda]